MFSQDGFRPAESYPAKALPLGDIYEPFGDLPIVVILPFTVRWSQVPAVVPAIGTEEITTYLVGGSDTPIVSCWSEPIVLPRLTLHD